MGTLYETANRLGKEAQKGGIPRAEGFSEEKIGQAKERAAGTGRSAQNKSFMGRRGKQGATV